MVLDILCKKKRKIFLFVLVFPTIVLLPTDDDESRAVSSMPNIIGTGIAMLNSNTTIEGTLNSMGDFSVNTNNFNVASSSGNTTIAGTLGVTGTSALMGNTSIGGTLGVSGISTLSNDLHVTGSTYLQGTLSVNQNKMTVDAGGNTVIGGALQVLGALSLSGAIAINTLDVTGGLGSGWHHIFGEKSLTSIGTTATPVLNITFANLMGSTSPLLKGARIYVHATISGVATNLSTNSIIYYYGDFIVSPGATSKAPCTLITAASTAINAVGPSVILTGSITGSGTTATLNLATSLGVSNPSIAFFYEIISDNLASVS